MRRSQLLCNTLIAVSVVFLTDSVAAEQKYVPPKLEAFDLTDQQMTELMEAPKSFMVDKPSPVLREAMASWNVQRIRADRVADHSSPVVQGWIYFEPTDEVRPVILCVSQTGDDIKWMWCQEETRRLEDECN